MNVAAAMVQILVHAGIDTVFTIPGGASSAISHALTLEPRIRMVVCQNETTAGYAAAGWHRATGKPGVLVVTSGPGALACCAALAAARLDDDGIVVVAGDVSNRDRARGTLQDGGVRGLALATVMAPLARHVVRIEHAHQAAAAFTQALRYATGSRPQPVYVEIPIDVQQAPSEPIALLLAPAVADVTAMELAPLVDALTSGARPTLFLGRRVVRTGTGPLVARLAEALGAPVLVDAEARAAIPVDHPWRVGTYGIGDDGRGDAWLRAHPPDPLIVIGARLDDTTTAGFSTELLGSNVIHIDDVEEHVARAGTVRVGVLAPLPALLTRLLEALPPPRPTSPPERSAPAAVAALGTAPFEPCAAAAALQRAFAPGTVFTSDIGNHLLAALRAFTPGEPSELHFSLGLGGMGSGIGLAIGLAFGGLPKVVGLCGDGGIAMFGNELLTAVAWKVPLVLAVFQDGQLGMVRHGSENVYGVSAAYDVRFDIGLWARALGARAAHVESESQLRELAALPAEDGPLVLVFPIDPEARIPNPRARTFNFKESP